MRPTKSNYPPAQLILHGPNPVGRASPGSSPNDTSRSSPSASVKLTGAWYCRSICPQRPSQFLNSPSLVFLANGQPGTPMLPLSTSSTRSNIYGCPCALVATSKSSPVSYTDTTAQASGLRTYRDLGYRGSEPWAPLHARDIVTVPPPNALLELSASWSAHSLFVCSSGGRRYPRPRESWAVVVGTYTLTF